MNISSNDFISQSINMLDIKIGMHGFVKADSEWKSSGMAIPYSKLYYVLDGKGFITCDGKVTELLPGHVYLVPYRVKHGFWCESSMEKLYFHFTVTKTNGHDLLEGENKIFRLESSTADELKKLYFSSTAGDTFKLKRLIYDTISEFKDRFGLCNDREPEYSETVRRAIAYIRKNLSAELTVKKISESLYISESTLTKRFTRETGESIGRYIDGMVMTEAQRALIRNTESVKEISERLGFCDQFYFSRKFRQHYDITPSTYRKKHSNL